MKKKHVRFLTAAAGPDFSANPGDVRLVPVEQAGDLVDGGYAEYFVLEEAAAEPLTIESAALASDEKAVLPKPSRRKARG